MTQQSIAASIFGSSQSRNFDAAPAPTLAELHNCNPAIGEKHGFQSVEFRY